MIFIFFSIILSIFLCAMRAGQQKKTVCSGKLNLNFPSLPKKLGHFMILIYSKWHFLIKSLTMKLKFLHDLTVYPCV